MAEELEGFSKKIGSSQVDDFDKDADVEFDVNDYLVHEEGLRLNITRKGEFTFAMIALEMTQKLREKYPGAYVKFIDSRTDKEPQGGATAYWGFRVGGMPPDQYGDTETDLWTEGPLLQHLQKAIDWNWGKQVIGSRAVKAATKLQSPFMKVEGADQPRLASEPSATRLNKPESNES